MHVGPAVVSGAIRQQRASRGDLLGRSARRSPGLPKGSLRGAGVPDSTRARRDRRVDLSTGPGRRWSGLRALDPVQGAERRPVVPGGGSRILAGPALRNQGLHAFGGAGSDGERVASLSESELPHVGAVGILSVGRRLRVPGSAPGRVGAGLSATRSHPAADPAARRAAVCGRRRAALVAPAGRPRHPHPVCRRSALAAFRYRRLPDNYRRPLPPLRAGGVSAGAAAAGRRRRALHGAGRWRSCRRCLRALLPSDRSIPGGGAAGAPVHGKRRLERRDEPSRPAGAGGERMAGLLSLHHSPEISAALRPSERRSTTAGGTADGTDEHTTTTEARWARPRATSAGSTPSPRPGRCSRVRRRAIGPRWRSTRWNGSWWTSPPA